MSGGFFSGVMRNAAITLFVVAVIVLVAGIVPAFTVLSAGDSSSPFSAETSHLTALSALLVIVSAIHNAALPLFGAAVLWRWDRFVGMKTGAAQ